MIRTKNVEFMSIFQGINDQNPWDLSFIIMYYYKVIWFEYYNYLLFSQYFILYVEKIWEKGEKYHN